MYHFLNILHIDMDAFFASVEQAKNKKYKNKPIAVCGSIGERGVISASSYEAKKYGISSGMPVKLAKSKFPPLILIEADFSLYKKISNEIMQIILKYSPDYEQYSIDEIFLDVSSTKKIYKNQLNIALNIQSEIKNKFDITCSIGISENKLLAKFATELNKPNGITILSKNRFIKISENMGISKLHGIGKKTANLLNSINIKTLGEMRKLSLYRLKNLFGIYGEYLYNAIRGIDNSSIEKEHNIKSIGNETTLDYDTSDKEVIKSIILKLATKTARRLRKENKLCKTISLKIRYFNFQTFSTQKTLNDYTDNDNTIYQTAIELFNKIKIKPVRLIGITLFSLIDKKDYSQQLSLFDNKNTSKIDKITDLLKDKFGENAIDRASILLSKPKKIF